MLENLNLLKILFWFIVQEYGCQSLLLKPKVALILVTVTAFLILSLVLDILDTTGLIVDLVPLLFVTRILNFFFKAVWRRFLLFFRPCQRAFLLLTFSGLYLDSSSLLSSAFLHRNFLGDSMMSLLLELSIVLAIQALADFRSANLRPSGLMKSSALFSPWRRLTVILLQSLGRLVVESWTEERVYILQSGWGATDFSLAWLCQAPSQSFGRHYLSFPSIRISIKTREALRH